jgi:hypothetical protein
MFSEFPSVARPLAERKKRRANHNALRSKIWLSIFEKYNICQGLANWLTPLINVHQQQSLWFATTLFFSKMSPAMNLLASAEATMAYNSHPAVG